LIQKYEREAKEKNRESWYLAYVMDTNEEERAKGKTVEVGRAHFETPSKRYTILDAPGHKNYVPNMIGGAAQADIGILVCTSCTATRFPLNVVLIVDVRSSLKRKKKILCGL
jgi:peptide chain release factor subunit 3